MPRGFGVEVETSETGDGPFEIEYRVRGAAEAAGDASDGGAPGGGSRQDRALRNTRWRSARINIGRMAELTDAEQRVVRRNDVVFEEGGDEANATVSRKHAHIRLEGGDYRICDDGSEFGTRVFRDGRPIDVPAGQPARREAAAGRRDLPGPGLPAVRALTLTEPRP